MKRKTIGMAAAALAATGALAVTAASMATAETSPTTTSTATATPNGPSGATGQSGPNGTQGQARASQDTPVTGAEADKVIAAVKAKDSAATITTVQKDPDGSYDALGTKSGSPVRYDVSADLKTITEGKGGQGGKGGPGGASQDTPVTGAEADKVIAAVKAKDSAASITTVRKDPDGSYDALGTKSGSPVFYDVSKDLATITANTGGPGGGHGGPGGPAGGQGANGSTLSTNPTDANGTTSTN